MKDPIIKGKKKSTKATDDTLLPKKKGGVMLKHKKSLTQIMYSTVKVSQNMMPPECVLPLTSIQKYYIKNCLLNDHKGFRPSRLIKSVVLKTIEEIYSKLQKLSEKKIMEIIVSEKNFSCFVYENLSKGDQIIPAKARQNEQN